MVEYRIYPLEVGRIKSLNGSSDDMLGCGASPVLAFYLEGGPSRILVDTGLIAGAQEVDNSLLAVDTDYKALAKALGELDLKPEDIDILILTRIPPAVDIKTFTRTRVIFPGNDCECANSGIKILGLSELEAYEVAFAGNGLAVADGVKVITVPGDNVRQQAVVVNTNDGIYVLVSNLIYDLTSHDYDKPEYTDIFGNKIACTLQVDHAYYTPLTSTDLSYWTNILSYLRTTVGKCKRIISGNDPTLLGKVLPER